MSAARLGYDPRRHVVSSKPAEKARDLVCQEGNEALAAELNRWWAIRGYPQVKFEAVRRHNYHPDEKQAWTVTSNLHNALPPKVTK